jgi:RNA-directed DNA polymerase
MELQNDTWENIIWYDLFNFNFLGTFKRHAIFTALSRRGPWHLSRTMATQAGMTNKWLSEQGLIFVKEQWVKINYPASAR